MNQTNSEFRMPNAEIRKNLEPEARSYGPRAIRISDTSEFDIRNLEFGSLATPAA